jgi:hypothetical protein
LEPPANPARFKAIGRDQMAQSAIQAVTALEKRLTSPCIADPALGLAAG